METMRSWPRTKDLEEQETTNTQAGVLISGIYLLIA